MAHKGHFAVLGVEKNEELGEKFKKLALEMQDDLLTQKSLTFQQGLD